jgi:hypothetical protein
MANRTPVSLRLRTGSPGFKLPSKRLNFASAEEAPVVAAAAVAPAPVAAAVAVVVVASPPSRKTAVAVSPLKQPQPRRAMSDEKMFLNLQPAPVAEAPRAVNVSASDEVPAEIRSFGSSLSMLQAAFGSVEGLSNVSLGSLSLDGSSSSSTTLPDGVLNQPSPPLVSSAPFAPSVGPAMAPRSGVQERLRKMLKARMAARRDDESSAGVVRSPSHASLTSPRIEQQMAWSPVIAGAFAPDDTLGNVSDMSLMLADKLGKVSLSFRDEDIATVVDEANAILEAKERKIDSLKLDIQQLHETVAAKSPVRRKGSVGTVDEENLVNKAPSLIPRPGTRSRAGRVLSRK